MANTLGGLTADELGQMLGRFVDLEMDRLLKLGLTREQAAQVINATLGSVSDRMANGQSPRSG